MGQRFDHAWHTRFPVPREGVLRLMWQATFGLPRGREQRVGAAEPIEPLDLSVPANGASAPSSIPVDGLSSHLASLLKTLDEEVRRLREQAEREAAQIVDHARSDADRIAREADERVTRAEATRQETLEQRDRIAVELRTLRDSIVELASELDADQAEATDDVPVEELPPAPKEDVDEDASVLWTSEADDAAIDW